MGETDSPGAPVSTPLVGTMLGRYRIERVLGEGGMGTVYAGVHQDLGKAAAVKTLHERYGRSNEVQLRFLREAQAASRIRHPNIVDVYDVGSESGRTYLVMELLEGESLARLIARDGPLSARQAADLMVPVVSALAAVHDLGVIHRDLKPDNIFLANERHTLQPKVLDFGISKVADQQITDALTGTGILVGTPYYMSPEQAKAMRNIDARADQYAVGVILYECTTARRPIEEQSIYQLVQRIVEGDFPTPRQANPAIPPAFEKLILRAMETDPAARFPTTRALGRALMPFASERIRSNYADEFATDTLPQLSNPISSAPSPLPNMSTTLGESVHERDTTRKTTTTWPLFATLGVLMLGGAGILAWRGTADERVEPKATAGPVPSVPPATSIVHVNKPPPPDTKPASIQRKLVSVPPGATVLIDDKKVGETPFQVDVPRGESVSVAVQLAGFEAQTRQLSESDPEVVSIQLERRRAATKPTTTKRPPPSGDRPALAPR